MMEESTDRPESVEVEARDLEDAIAEGLARLGLSRDRAEIEILEEPKGGFLGIGARKARVRVSVKGHRRASERRAERPERPARQERSRRSERSERPEREEEDGKPETPINGELVEEVVLKLVRTLDEAATVSGASRRSGRYECEIETREPALLLGRRGRTLDALQTLATALVARRTGDRVRVNLDIGGFRARRKEVLVAMANEAAADAVRSGEDIHLEAMFAHERKIVHSALAQNQDVTTESIDNGDRRHVVVQVKGSSRPGVRSGRSDRDRDGRGGRDGDRRRGRGGFRGGRRRERRDEPTERDAEE